MRDLGHFGAQLGGPGVSHQHHARGFSSVVEGLGSGLWVSMLAGLCVGPLEFG